jgi:hypothetical protein
VASLRENDYFQRSFVGNYHLVFASGQNAQANPATLVGDRRAHQLVSGIELQRSCDRRIVIKEDLQIKRFVAL